jgi:hypothetical protein
LTDSERLIKIETIVGRLQHDLFGNGKPGLISEHEDRIKKLERFMWVAVALALASGAAGAHIIEAAIR